MAKLNDTRSRRNKIESFDFDPGIIVARKYQIEDKIGSGWESEVYRVRELSTGIERAAKFFFPHRNIKNKISTFYAKKLHKLRDCHILIQYVTQETLKISGQPVTMLISEFVEGELLSEFIARQIGSRLGAFQALHLLHALATGMDKIHRKNEYHGDLHSDNVIVHRSGLGFELKLLDLYHWRAPRPENIQDDVVNLIHIFHEALGGPRHYARQPAEIKNIICGLKRSLIIKKFRTAGQLKDYLENMEWGAGS